MRLERSPRPIRLAACLALAATVLLSIGIGERASAETSILASDGTLYDVMIRPYRDVVPGASVVPNAKSQDFPVVALRTTRPDGKVTFEVADGTLTAEPKGLPAIEIDETTGTVLVCYSKYVGGMSDLHVAVLRDGRWVGRDILPNAGLYLSLNPQLTASRQRYVDSDGKGGTVTKARTIFSLVWWEESGLSQARYAPIFVEDGVLSVDSVVAYNLNDLMGSRGVTDISGLPASSYMFPSVQRDPASPTGGAVLVAFANLVTRRESVISITFPDNLTTSGTAGSPGGDMEAQVRAHIPVGRQLADGPIPENRDTQADVGYFISSSGRATSWWADPTGIRYIQNDAAEGAQPKTIPLRPDLPIDRALSVIREMTLKD